MLLSWAVSCDSYELHDDGTANIYQAGIDTFTVESLPLDLPVSVALKVLLQEGEEAELEFHVLGPETTPLAEPITFPLVGTPGPHHRPGYVVSAVGGAGLRSSGYIGRHAQHRDLDRARIPRSSIAGAPTQHLPDVFRAGA